MSATPADVTRFFDGCFATVPVMAILRGHPPERTVELAEKAWDLGVTQVEVPLQDPDALPSLRAAVAAGSRRGMGVGAGTVTTPERLHLARDAGAAFTVAPGYDEDVLDESLATGIPHLPGVSTPSEAGRARRRGLHWVKAFPASHLGPAWVRAVRAPFPDLRIVATGGVDAENAGSFLHAGARVVALGAALADPSQLDRVTALLARDGADDG
ncbi:MULTISPECIES: bifunctional 4-hydroxy-2-oxoglutarate aldolase/2-dehydro-3-deoxy-phosphogluconate aldolase [unclassified Streptomyces]|uniref:bifunctional 4-hydroxy-2-oxoglutarate aldolase/2-dehydro-3-deoxy-phosphogluconate aldolase n=1 Tax=unclassified Streptomyces TaxID=2593676 RepID=UPI00081B2BAF|nr:MULTISPECIES: bifunctional 4-hydroxy-2-oxoglutarate aldolase/2-dehydro-3-deoxy-phosphogluconate aldolase [unclassified Streptomyces]SCD94283.1 2-keto-3-deoxy-phosphogluconate aldolase [Streptomyces sp. PalvLS-984]SDB86576.1 2-keto-3-deoxy-phosphogluconate aldolase [Streptomyces sp. AmelKG-A3]